MKIDNEWSAHFQGILDNILKNGYYKPEYVHSKGKRMWYMCNFTICSMVCCAPCCMWDTLCCTSERVCGKSCCWGAFCLFAKASVESTYEKGNKIQPHTTFDVSEATVRDMCKRYLIEFDACVAARTVKQARMANEIREWLVYILQTYLGQSGLEDDGDIAKIRKLVYNY